MIIPIRWGRNIMLKFMNVGNTKPSLSNALMSFSCAFPLPSESVKGNLVICIILPLGKSRAILLGALRGVCICA